MAPFQEVSKKWFNKMQYVTRSASGEESHAQHMQIAALRQGIPNQISDANRWLEWIRTEWRTRWFD